MNIGEINQSAGTGAGTERGPAKKPESQTNSLQSWKEIAAYLKRGVRTAQRWESCAGLPVRRPRLSEHSPVFAFPEEIDRWLHSSGKRLIHRPKPIQR
jgi:hypothetical protein